MGSKAKTKSSDPILAHEEKNSIYADLRSLWERQGNSCDKNDLWVMVIYPPLWNSDKAVLEKGVLLSNRVDALCQFYPALKKSFWLISDSGTPLPLFSREADALLYALPQPQASRLGFFEEADLDETSIKVADLETAQLQELSAKTIWHLMPETARVLPQSVSLFQDHIAASESAFHPLKRSLQTSVDFSEASLSDETGLGYWMTQVAFFNQKYGLRLKLQVQFPFESLDLTQENTQWTDAQKTALTGFLLRHPDWANSMTWVPQNNLASGSQFSISQSQISQSAIYLVCGSIWQDYQRFLTLAKAGALVCLPSYSDCDTSGLVFNELKALGPVHWKALGTPSDWPQAWLGFWADQKNEQQKNKQNMPQEMLEPDLAHYLDLWDWHERVLSGLSCSPNLAVAQFASFSSESFRRQLKSQWGVSVENWVYHKETLGLFSHSLTDFHRFYLAFQIHFNASYSNQNPSVRS